MRPSLDSVFLKVALVLSERSTCLRKKVGGILVSSEGKIISSGWNGVPKGHVHCEDHFHDRDPSSKEFYEVQYHKT